MADKKFAAKLVELRAAKGMTQAALAEKAGLSVAGVRDLEYGRRQPTWATVRALAKGLGVSVAAFEEKPKRKR